MTWPQWICFLTLLAILDIYVLAILWPYSNINEQTKHQLQRLVFLKSVLQRITRDEEMLASNPRRIRQQIIRKAVYYLQKETAHISDSEERKAKLLELANEAYEAINEGIDLLEKELDHRP